MSYTPYPQVPKINIRDNFLLVDGETLSLPDTTPQRFGAVLDIGHQAIISGIEEAYRQTRAKQSPATEVARPSILSLLISSDARHLSERSEFISTFGLRNRTGVHRHPIEVTPLIQPYWSATEGNGFTTEVRNLGQSSLYLALRNPETDPVPLNTLEYLPEALGFRQLGRMTQDYKRLKQAYESNDPNYRLLLDQQDAIGQTRVDMGTEYYGSEFRPSAQIGLIVATANLRLSIEGPDFSERYIEHLRDAEEYAYGMGYDDVSECIKKEIERFDR